MNQTKLFRRVLMLALALTLFMTAALPAFGAEPGFINFQNKRYVSTACPHSFIQCLYHPPLQNTSGITGMMFYT